MDCRNSEDLMAGLIDDELSPGQHELLQDHLQRCPDCSTMLEQLVEQPLSPPPMQPMDGDFWSKMDGALATELTLVEQEAASPIISRPPRWRPSPALIFYAATLMFALGWGLYAQHELEVSQAETAMLRDALDRERRLSVQPASLPVKGYQFANHTPNRGTF